MWQRHSVYRVQLPRNPIALLLAVALAVGAGIILLALLMALLAVAAGAAVVGGGVWLTWRLLRSLQTGGRPMARSAPASKRMNREVRGLLELAATPNPMEQYLIAVREFERISMAALALDPQNAGSRRVRLRALELAEQIDNLSDAVAGVERRLMADPTASGARTHVWELALATREVAHYLDRFADVRGAPRLAEVRTLVAQRSELASRRTALVDRLDDVEVTRSLPEAIR